MLTEFSSTYVEARDEFKAIAMSNGYGLTRSVLPGYQGPNGEKLSCDIATKKRGSDTVVVSMSAVHGIEGYAGSALQRHWMRAVDYEGDVDVMHIHALNPFGFAWSRRTNENNVDINRNSVPFPIEEPNPKYAMFADVIVPKKLGLISEIRKYAAIAKNGMRNLQDVLSQGQYSFPDGMFYGGNAPTWSRKILEDLIKQRLAGYKKIILEDLHTGLGKGKGNLELLYTGEENDAGYQEIVTIWPDQKIGLLSKGKNTSVSSSLTGETFNSFKLVGRTSGVLCVAFEFSSAALLQVFGALQKDHVAWANNEADPKILSEAAQAMRDAFAPQDAEFERKVIVNGMRVHRRLLQHLKQ